MSEINFLIGDDAAFVDLSKDVRDFLRDETAFSFVALEDALYFGLDKKFNSVYAELSVASLIDQDFTFEMSNSGGFMPLSVDDDTKGFQRSGFIQWERKQDDWEKDTVNGKELYWIKLTAPNDFDFTLKGFDLVFADDNDLRQEIRDIDDMLAVGDSSFIAYHLSVRNEIVQTLRNGGNYNEKLTNIGVTLSDIDHWDVLEIGQIRQAAKYLCLAKIYFDVSENPDDKAYMRFKDFLNFYGQAFKLFRMSIDFNDDGVNDLEENLTLNNVTVSKV